MIGCLPTQALAFLAVFVYATHATQAIAFEWKPGFSIVVRGSPMYSKCEVVTGLLQCKHCGKSFASHAAHDSHVRRTHAALSTIATVTNTNTTTTTTTTATAAAAIFCSFCRMTFLHPHQLNLHICPGQSLITHVDGSRVSIAIIRLCV